MILIDLLFPCLSFFFRGKIFAGIIALILQITVIGWIISTIWAIVARINAKNEKQFKKIEGKLNSLNSEKEA